MSDLNQIAAFLNEEEQTSTPETAQERFMRLRNAPLTDPERSVIAADAFKETFGFDNKDGSRLSPDRMTPLTGAQYSETLGRVFEQGLSTLDTPELTAWKAVDPEDRETRLKLAREKRGFIGNLAAGLSASVMQANPSSFSPQTSIMSPDVIAARDKSAEQARINDEDELISSHESALFADNWLALYKTAEPELSPAARDIAQRAAESGEGIGENDVQAFMNLPKPEARIVSHLAKMARPVRTQNAFKEGYYQARDMVKDMAINTHDLLEETDLYDYPSLTFNKTNQGISRQGWRDIAARKRLLRSVDRGRPYDNWSIPAQAVVGTAATIPYMAQLSVGYVGIPLTIMQQFQSTRNDIRDAGGNEDEGFATQAASAIAYAYIERLQLMTLTKPITTMGYRALFVKIAKGGAWNLAKTAGKEVSAKTVTETLQDMTQEAIAAVPEANAADKEVIAEMTKAFINDAKAWPTFLLMSSAGTAGNFYGATTAHARNSDLEEALIRKMKLELSIAGDTYKPDNKKQAETLKQARNIWNKAGSETEASAQIIEKLDLSNTSADALCDYFAHERAYLTMPGSNASFTLQPITDIQTAVTMLIPGAKVQSLSPLPSDEAAAPEVSIDTEPAQRIVTKTEWKNGKPKRTWADNPAHAEWQARQAASAATNQQQEQAIPQKPNQYLVTLPNGGQYNIDTTPFDTDIESPGFAASVEFSTGGRVKAADYLALDKPSKQIVLNANRLADRGHFSVTRPDGTKVTDSAGIISLILDPRDNQKESDTGTLLHEHAHAALQIARDAKMLTDREQGVLEQVFQKQDGTFDEEKLAQTFIDFAARKALPEQYAAQVAGPFSRIKAGLFNFIRSSTRMPESQATQLAQAKDAAYTAILTGDFAGLSPYAGITFRENAKPSAQTKQQAAPSVPPGPTSEELPPPDVIDETSATAVKEARAAAAPADTARPPSRMQQQLDQMQQQIAEIAKNMGNRPAASSQGAPLTRAQEPRDLTIVTPTGNIEFTAQWAWAPLDSLVTSDSKDYPQQFQPRDRSRVASAAQVAQLSRKGTFKAIRLTDSVESDGGSPILAGGNVVISGNGRTFILRTVRNEKRYADEYLHPVMRWAEQRGIDAPPADMSHPVLVRRITSAASEADLQKIAELSNRAKILQRSESETAEADAKILTPQLLSVYNPGSDGNMLAASNAPFMQAFIKAAGGEGATDSKGRADTTLAARVANAMMAAVIGTDAQARELIRAMLERDPKAALGNLNNSLLAVAGTILDNDLSHPKLAIRPWLQQAVREYIGWRTSASEMTLEDFIAQPDMIRGDLSPETQAIMRIIKDGRLTAVMHSYAELARTDNSNTGAIFADFDRTPLQVLALADRATLQEGQTTATPDPDQAASMSTQAPVQAAAEPKPEPAPQEAPAPTPEPTALAEDPVDALPHTPTPIDLRTVTIPEGKRVFDVVGKQKTIQTDNFLKNIWNKAIPLFQGGKRGLSFRATAALANEMTAAERASYTHLWDGFGGSGGWALYHANTSFLNADTITIGEFNPNRKEKIKYFHQKGDQIEQILSTPEYHNIITRAKELMVQVRSVAAAEEARQYGQEQEVSATTSAGSLSKALYKALAEAQGKGLKDTDIIAVTQAVADRAANGAMNAADTRDLIYDEVIRGTIEDAKAIRAAAKTFADRGGKFIYRETADTYASMPPAGANVFAFIDPPYYATTGYNEENGESEIVGVNIYGLTRDLLARVADQGNGIMYTDSAWWMDNPQMAQEDMFSAENEDRKILLDIFNKLDYFDVVSGLVGQRHEVIGVQHGHTTEATNAQQDGTSPQLGDSLAALQQEDNGRVPAGESSGTSADQELFGMAGGNAEEAAAVRSSDDPVVRHQITADHDAINRWLLTENTVQVKHIKYLPFTKENRRGNQKIALEEGKKLRGEYRNKDTGRSFKITKASIVEIMRHNYLDDVHMNSIASIPDLIKNSIHVATATNEKPERNDKILTYDYFLSWILDESKTYAVRSVIATTVDGATYYDHKLTKMKEGEKKNSSEVTSSAIDPITLFASTDDTRLLQIMQAHSDSKKNLTQPRHQITSEASSQTTTPEFNAWFKSSKIVNEDGTPKIVYHGSREDFSVFDIKKSTDKLGIFFADRKTGTWGEERNFFISMQNPLVVTQGQDYKDKLMTGETQPQLRKRLQKEGYDGIIMQYHGGLTDYIAFKPTQIKSATENVGTFDSKDPDIKFQVAAEIGVKPKDIEEARAEFMEKGYKASFIQKWIGKRKVISQQDKEKYKNKLPIKTGEPVVISAWHGTPNIFRDFEEKYILRAIDDDDGMGPIEAGLLGPGFYASYKRDVAQSYAIELFNPETETPGIAAIIIRLENPLVVDPTDNTITTRSEEFKKGGYDGIVMNNGEEIVFIDSKQVGIFLWQTYDGTKFPWEVDQRHQVTAFGKPIDNPVAMLSASIAYDIAMGGKPNESSVSKIAKAVGLNNADSKDILARAKRLATEIDPKTEEMLARIQDRRIIDQLATQEDRDMYVESKGASFHHGQLSMADAPIVAKKMEKARQRTAKLDIESAEGIMPRELALDVGIDLSAAILNTPDIQPTADEQERLDAEREKALIEAEKELDAMGEQEEAQQPLPPSQEMNALREQLMAEADAKTEADRLEEERKKLEKAQNKKQNEEDGIEMAENTASGFDAEKLAEDPLYQLIAPVIANPAKWVNFIYAYAYHKISAARPHLDPKRLWKDPAALRDLQRTFQHILRKLATDHLQYGPARLAAEKDIADMTENTRVASTLKDALYIYAKIHANALRISRHDRITQLERDISRIAIDGAKFQEAKRDDKRKVTAKVEKYARTIRSYLRLKSNQIQAETTRLNEIIAGATRDQEITKAQSDAIDAKEVLRKFGGMINWMPEQISEAAAWIIEDLSGKREAFELAREQRLSDAMKDASAIAQAITPDDPDAARPEMGMAGRFWDALLGNMQQRLENLTRFCKNPKKRQAAMRSIENMMVEFGEAAQEYQVMTLDGRKWLNKTLRDIYGAEMKGIRHLDEKLPSTVTLPDGTEASTMQLTRHGNKLTYGQAIQLYGSILQDWYAENVRIHQRHKDLPILKAVLTAEDMRLHQAMMSWYRDNRAALSAAQERITGLPILTPDPFYIPVRMRLDPEGAQGRHLQWTPILKTLTPRVKNRRDFDEDVGILDTFSESLDNTALVSAYGERGIHIVQTLLSSDVLGSTDRYHGGSAMNALRQQVEDTLRAGATLVGSDAAHTGVALARRWTARFGLSGNIASALKQPASIPVLASVVGFRDLIKYLRSPLSFEGREAIRELMQSDGYRARYEAGWSPESADILSQQHVSWLGKLYDKGLAPNRAMDAVAALWIGQGLYRDLKSRYIDEGMSKPDAIKRAQTVTWNLVEQTQQSGRQENLPRFIRDGGQLARFITQFQLSQMQQMAFEITAAREVAAGTPGSKAKLLRALIINHVLIPGFMLAIREGWNALLGEPPPDDEKKKSLFIESIVASVLGQFSALWILGSMGKSGIEALLGERPRYGVADSVPAAGIVRVTETAARTVSTGMRLIYNGVIQPADMYDVTTEDLLKDLDRLADQVAAPYRQGSKAYRNYTAEQ